MFFGGLAIFTRSCNIARPPENIGPPNEGCLTWLSYKASGIVTTTNTVDSLTRAVLQGIANKSSTN